jgi:hypothetical protein
VERHLLPDEIDQLLDGEVGFGSAPLKAHVRSCDHCRGELETASRLVHDLEHIPHLAPSSDFSNKVMSRVQIFVPWYVALGDSVRSLVPRSRGWRIAAMGGLATAALVLTTLSVLALTRLDGVLFVAEMVWDNLRGGAMSALSGLVAALLGDGAGEAFRASGAIGVGVLFAAVGLTGLIAFGTLRAVAARSRAR